MNGAILGMPVARLGLVIVAMLLVVWGLAFCDESDNQPAPEPPRGSPTALR
jgi:hypothetical protein